MKSCTKLRMMQLTALFIVLFFSCKKDNLQELKNSPHTNPRKEFSNADLFYNNANKSSTTSFRKNSQIILETEETLRELILNSLVQTALHPEVYGLTSTQVETRSCPNSSSTTASGGTGNVHTVILDYETGCSTSGNATYEGLVTITLNGDLNQTGTTVNIALDDNFKLNSDNDMDGFIELSYFNDFGQIYYFVDSINLENTNNADSPPTVTEVFSISSLQNGGFYVAENLTGDVPNSPLNIVNDTIQYGGCFHVHCPNGDILQSCTTSDIYYTVDCGVPYEGDLVIDTMNVDGSFGGSIPHQGSFGDMDFSFPNAINQGVCDSLIRFENNITNELDTMRL